jgi:UDP:flavonoid glycosyltransferase YjiC (YdhE family)
VAGEAGASEQQPQSRHLHAVSKHRAAIRITIDGVRILFSAGPMFGHVNTMLPLADAARRAGHDVVVATGPDLVDHVARHGLATWTVGPSHEAAGGRAALSPEYFTTAGTARAEDLVPQARSWRPDVVVHEEMELAGAVVAGVTGARHVVHGLGLLPPRWVWDVFTPVVVDLGQRFGARGAIDPRGATYLRVSPPSLDPDGDVVWDDVRLVRAGFGAASSLDRMPGDLDEFVRAAGDPVVHLTLGTVFHRSPGVLEGALAGLRDLRIRLVVTTGPDVDPGSFGPQPGNVRITRYVPHALFLRRCAVVVSHGGAGIMFAALTNGIPQLLLPQGADQFGNAAACRAAGAALVLGPEEVTPDAVAMGVRRLLVSPSFWANASRLRRSMAAMPSPGEVLAGIVADVAAAA